MTCMPRAPHLPMAAQAPGGLTAIAPGERRVAVGPWFRERPQLAVAVSVLLLVATGTAGVVSSSARDAGIVVLVLPVALLAVTFGLRGGVGGAGGVLAALLTWQARQGHASGATWGGAIAIVMLGLLLGSAVDGLVASARSLREADARRLHAEHAADRAHEAAVLNDTLVQSVAVAKWALEAGDVARAVEVLDEAVDKGQRIVSELLRET